MKRILIGALVGVSVFFPSGRAAAEGSGISLYASAPGIQTAETSGLTGGNITTETFNSIAAGSISAGTFLVGANGGTYSATSGAASINANNQYGGYAQGNYLSVNGAGGTVTISFATGVAYFGFLWSAGDGSNRISLYSTSDELMVTYSTSDLVGANGFFPHDNTTTKTAVNGDNYFTGNYYGQPTATGPVATVAPNQQQAGNSPTLNTNEPYAYLHFISTASNIGKIVFEKPVGTGGGNFENDNHSVSVVAPTVTNASVLLVQENLPVPEPTTTAMLVAVGGTAAAFLFSRKSKNL